MARRTSIHVAGFRHAAPIPAACRVGNLVVSSGIHGIDPETGKLAATLEEQCRLMFHHMRRILEAAGASTDDIVKMTVWMIDRSQRGPLNKEWLALFPDEAARPACHTMQANLDGGMLIQCDVMAVIGGG